MIATINTDASYSAQHKVGAFAFWIVCDEFKVQKSGLFKEKVGGADEAEIKCILNAFTVVNRERSPQLTKVIINTDSMNAIYILRGDERQMKYFHLSRWGKKFYTMFKKLTRGLDVELRHVKAHSGAVDARSFVNEWCDQKAKEELRKAIKQPVS